MEEYLDDENHAYTWMDFNVIDTSGKKFSFRMEYNNGDADANTGAWGYVWNRLTGEEVLRVEDAHTDCASIITLTSSSVRDEYKPHLDITDAVKLNSDSYLENAYTNDHELEKIIGVAMRIRHSDCIIDVYPMLVEIQTIVLERIFSSNKIFIPVEILRLIAQYAPAPKLVGYVNSD